jgi:glycosyltransferase involved in cell wall biosynthesis
MQATALPSPDRLPVASSSEPVELTILMPCLNEVRTVATCISKAQRFLSRSGVVGEILIADNGSTDGSVGQARGLGARVISVPYRGYGAALIAGIQSAQGRFVVMGDSDDSYDFEQLDMFVEQLRAGSQLVMGNRFKGGIEPGAMPPLHRWLGNPVLSGLGRLMFRADVGDFHCGLRGFEREAVVGLRLSCPGMEFASEMVLKACLAGLRVAEVPATLRPDGRDRPPHLRSWQDGWRHLRLMLLYSPTWLFAFPGCLLLLAGLFGQLALMPGMLTYRSVGFDVHTLLFCAGSAIVGLQLVLFGLLAKLFAVQQGILPRSRAAEAFMDLVPVEAGVITGAGLVVAGVVLTISSLVAWEASGWGRIDPVVGMRTVIPAVTMVVAGIQVAFSAMFVGVLGLRRSATHIAEPLAPALSSTQI